MEMHSDRGGGENVNLKREIGFLTTKVIIECGGTLLRDCEPKCPLE